jgi:hypothetical protein
MLNLDSFLLQVSVQKLLYSRRRITVELFHEFSGLGRQVKDNELTSITAWMDASPESKPSPTAPPPSTPEKKDLRR